MRRVYQVFVSSTFTDLVEARNAVFRQLQKMECMPVGMEQFSAGGTLPWDIIEPLIAGSDYYCLIIGNRYGSTLEGGISYTQREYEYAKSLKKWTMPHLHRDPASLPMNKGDQDESKWQKLQDFMAKVRAENTVETWDTNHELAANVVTALSRAIVRHPQPGWVRGEILQQTNRGIDEARTILEEALQGPSTLPIDGPDSDPELASKRRDVLLRVRQIVVDDARGLPPAPDRPTADELATLPDEQFGSAIHDHPLVHLWLSLIFLVVPEEKAPRWERVKVDRELDDADKNIDAYLRTKSVRR